MRSENPGTVVSGALSRLEPLRSVYTDALEVASYEAGPSEGDVVLLLHGFSYDIHSYVDVISRLVEAGHRVIAPCLRGHGPTHFLDSAATRSEQQAAMLNVNYLGPHCLMVEFYFERRGCLTSNRLIHNFGESALAHFW